MFQFAVLIGIYSYIIFFLGITHVLYKEIVIITTVGFWVVCMVFFRSALTENVRSFRKGFNEIKSQKQSLIIFSLTVILCIVNLIGALGPELSFDALWYHLTLPKLYLLNNAVYHIPGGLLYYSDMPKLGELLYTGALAFGNEITAKVLHFIFGIMTGILIYNISRKFFSVTISLIAVLIFFSNLVVAWESITAYIDLIRTFFEVSALAVFINWWNTKRDKYFYFTAVLLGLAVASKILALGSVLIFSLLILYRLVKNQKNIFQILPFIFITLLIPLPWFVFAYMHTGNPIYPIFSDMLSGLNAKIFDVNLLNPINFISTLWNTFTQANDPLSPIYIIFLPLIILVYKKFPQKMLYGYSLVALCTWYITSQIEGTRLLMPYLPAFSMLCAGSLAMIQNDRKTYGVLFPQMLLVLIILIAISTAGYRFIANARYIPVIIGQKTEQQFLTEHLNFSFGDFYDTDDYFSKNIKSTDKVLLVNFHNLYYVNFPFVDLSWIQKGETFNYIAVQKGEVPDRFRNWKKVYSNPTTHVTLYSDGGKRWTY